jgi:uncharacterized protein
MKIFSASPLILLFLLSCQILRSQTDSLVFNSTGDLISKAGEFHDKGDYQASLNLLRTVNLCDPEYPRACYEMALSYYYSGKNETAIAKCREAEFLLYNEVQLFSLMGSIYDDMGKTDTGIVILEKALKTWPYNTNLLYNLGVCYLKAGEPAKAEQVLLNGILYNPYHAKSHMALARANFAMGRIAESYMAYNMAILLNPSLNNIKEYENAISGRLNIVPHAYQYPYPDGYDHSHWDYIKALLLSEFAFKDDYEFKSDVNFSVTRQSSMLLSNLQYRRTDNSLYNNLYARFFNDIYQSGRFNVFMYYFLKNSDNQKVNDWINANTDQINGFVSWAQDFLNKGRSVAFTPDRQDKGIRYFHYNKDGILASIGNTTGEENVKNGSWMEINTDGSVRESGNYVNDKIEGEWLIYWPDGSIKQRLMFHDGLWEGQCLTYFPDGSKSGSYPMHQGRKNGSIEEYTASGNLISINTVSNGMLNGPCVFNDYANGFTRKFDNVLDSAEGRHTETWMNGQPKQESFFHKAKYEGILRTWYVTGQPESEYNYVHGMRTGNWTRYYMNGIPEEKGVYDSTAHFTGEYQSFDRDGHIAVREKEYTGGLLNGTSIAYFASGKESVRRTYVHDTLIKIESFNGSGKLVYQDEAKNNSLYFKSFYEDGILKAEGRLTNGKKQDSWKNYNPQGMLVEDRSFVDGMEAGPQKVFSAEGSLKEEYQCDSNKIIGAYREYFNNGHIMTAGRFDKNGRNGEFDTYYPNDTIQSRAFYINGIITGILLRYGPTGAVMSEEFYDSEGKDVRLIVFDQTGKIMSDLKYEYGTKRFETKYPSGQIRAINNISDNSLHGMQETYYPNGQLATQVNYVHGKLDGVGRSWDATGNITGEFQYALGDPNGLWKWYENGKLSFETTYEHDLYQGKARAYYQNGKISREIMYKDDLRDGLADYFASDGSFMYRLRYVEGCLKGYTWKDLTGKFVPEILIDQHTQQIVTKYGNGKISARIDLKNGILHGKYISYYPNGNVYHESEFNNGDNIGEERNYYPDGKLRERISYINDSWYGPYCLYYENGKKQLEGNYLDHQRNGDWHVYSNTGQETAVWYYFNGDLYEIRSK